MLALHLQKLRPIKVIGWSISGKDYLKECSNMTWNGLKQISHVAATILRNVRLEKGADIQVGSRNEQTSKFINKRAGLDTVFTWKLCVTCIDEAS